MTEIKRLNYFDAQFLHLDDFNDEQRYHLEMRRRHNQWLHSWGVAGGGLQVVKKGDKALEVAAGLAIDKDGREIVLLDPRPIALDSAATPNATVYVTARYDDPETDEDPSINKFKRRTEKPIIDPPKPTAPATDGSVILLATVKLNASGNIESVDNGVRRPAGPAPGTVPGSMKISGKNCLEFGAGVSGKQADAGKIGYQVFTNDALDIVGAGTVTSNRKIKFWAEGGTTFIGGLTVTGDATLKIHGTNTLEFGAGVSGKQADAGKIGYQALTPNDALDIVGAGTATTNRKIKLWAEGGATFTGGLTVTGDATLKKGLTVEGALTTLQNGLTVEKGATIKNGLTVEDGAVFIKGPRFEQSATFVAGPRFEQSATFVAGPRFEQSATFVDGPRFEQSAAFVAGARFEQSATFVAGAQFEGDVTLKNKLSFGKQYGDSLVLYDMGNVGTSLAAGVQDNTLYHRSSAYFAWYVGGRHSGTALDPGNQGKRLMSLTQSEVNVAGAKIGPGLTVEVDAILKQGLKVEGGATIKQEDWKLPRLEPSWGTSNVGGGPVAGFFKDSLGIVHLKGVIVNQHNHEGACMFKLPEEYKPATVASYIVRAGGGSGFVYLEIKDDQVALLGPSGSIDQIWLDGVTFRAK